MSHRSLVDLGDGDRESELLDDDVTSREGTQPSWERAGDPFRGCFREMKSE